MVKTTLFFINLINFYGKLDMNVANSDRFFSGFSIAEPLFSCAKLFNLQTLQLRSAAAVGCILRRWERRNDSTVHCKCLVFTKAKFYFFICGKSHPRLQAWMKYDEIDMMKYENIQNSDHQTAISAGGINGVLRGAVAQRRRRRRRRRCWQWTGWKCGETAF